MNRDMTLDQFISDVSSSSPAPGGGSVSAIGGAFSASLLEMAVRISGKIIQEDQRDHYLLKLSYFREQCMLLADDDTSAFKMVMEAYQLPKNNDEEKQIRTGKIQNALHVATEVPLKTAESCLAIMKLAEEILPSCKQNCISDTACGYYFAEAGLKGALVNVALNLSSLKDEEFKSNVKEKISALSNWLVSNSPKIEKIIKERMGL